jgi:hypothetical protein
MEPIRKARNNAEETAADNWTFIDKIDCKRERKLSKPDPGLDLHCPQPSLPSSFSVLFVLDADATRDIVVLESGELYNLLTEFFELVSFVVVDWGDIIVSYIPVRIVQRPWLPMRWHLTEIRMIH